MVLGVPIISRSLTLQLVSPREHLVLHTGPYLGDSARGMGWQAQVGEVFQREKRDLCHLLYQISVSSSTSHGLT